MSYVGDRGGEGKHGRGTGAGVTAQWVKLLAAMLASHTGTSLCPRCPSSNAAPWYHFGKRAKAFVTRTGDQDEASGTVLPVTATWEANQQAEDQHRPFPL